MTRADIPKYVIDSIKMVEQER